MDAGLLHSALFGFRAVITHYLTSSCEDAIQARTDVEKSSEGKDAFYGQFMVDLEYLCSVKGSSFLAAQEADPSTAPDYQALLNLLQRQIVPYYESASASNVARSHYTNAYYLRDVSRDLDFSNLTGDQLAGLCGILKLRDLSEDVRHSLVKASLRVVRHLKRHLEGVDPKNLSKSDNWATNVSTTFCEPLEDFHSQISGTWQCRCSNKHKRVYGSFVFPCDYSGSTASCILAFSSGSDHARPWKVVNVHISGTSRGRSQVSFENAGSASQTADSSTQDSSHALISNVHEWLADNSRDPKTAVRYSLGSKTFSEKAEREYSTSQSEKMIHINDCIAEGHLARVSIHQRLALAILLAYAFMNLGGGPWWSYQSDQVNVWLMDVSGVENLSPEYVLQPFLQAELPSSSKSQRECNVILRMMNQKMPNLPMLGKLILELLLGRSVSLAAIEEDGLKALELQLPECDIAAEAIIPCLGLDKDGIFKSDIISNNESLRRLFLERVIYKLNYILFNGSRIELKSLLHESHGTILTAKGKRRRSSSIEEPWLLKKPRSSSRRRVLNPMLSVPNHNRLCLHDDGTEENVDQKKAKRAVEWFEDMERVHDTFQMAGTCDPIKVAIIDTGVNFGEKLARVYGDRVVECRSWADPLDGKKGRDVSPGVDADGHGTHSVIAFLKTASTECSVYVAQVFQTRDEGLYDLGRSKDTDQGVANAIQYAVERWNVDIISMSFGYSKSVSVIDDALKAADREDVLMLAAASNVGGNVTKARAWPATRSNVVCVHATDGKGNPYDGNPTHKRHHYNFGILGEAVQLWSIPDDSGESPSIYRSGTSIATPIASGVAATVIEVVCKLKQIYIDGIIKERLEGESKHTGTEIARQLQYLHKEELENRYNNALTALKTADGIHKIFCLSITELARFDYDYIEPWKLLYRHDPSIAIITKILDTL